MNFLTALHVFQTVRRSLVNTSSSIIVRLHVFHWSNYFLLLLLPFMKPSFTVITLRLIIRTYQHPTLRYGLRKTCRMVMVLSTLYPTSHLYTLQFIGKLYWHFQQKLPGSVCHRLASYKKVFCVAVSVPDFKCREIVDQVVAPFRR